MDSGGYVYSWATNGMCEKGITRRDWLAGLAMQGIVSDDETWDKEDRHLAGLATPHYKRKPIILKAIANRCYELADAMIKEGKK